MVKVVKAQQLTMHVSYYVTRCTWPVDASYVVSTTCMAHGPQHRLALGVFAADCGQATSMSASASTFAHSAVPCYPRDACSEGRLYVAGACTIRLNDVYIRPWQPMC